MLRSKNGPPLISVNVVIPKPLHDRMLALIDSGTYQLSVSAVVRRGIALAVEELEKGRAP